MSIAFLKKAYALGEEPFEPYTETFNYTGGIQTFTVPSTGVYLFELSGANGGTGNGVTGSGGTYIKSYHKLTKNDTYYIIVGGAGAGKNHVWNGPTETLNLAGGYNGGGTGRYICDNNYSRASYGGGGGATHVSKENCILSATQDENNILAVAGGGAGGAGWYVINSTEGNYPGLAQSNSNGILGSGSNYANFGSGAGGGGLRGGTSRYSGTSLASSYSTYIQEVTYGARSGNGIAIVTRVA